MKSLDLLYRLVIAINRHHHQQQTMTRHRVELLQLIDRLANVLDEAVDKKLLDWRVAKCIDDIAKRGERPKSVCQRCGALLFTTDVHWLNISFQAPKQMRCFCRNCVCYCAAHHEYYVGWLAKAHANCGAQRLEAFQLNLNNSQ